MNRATDEDALASDRDENAPTPSEFLKLIRNWLEHYWDAPREASRWTDLAMVVLTVLIAAFAGWSAWIFQGQLTEAQRNTVSSQRAWVGIDRPIALSSLTFNDKHEGKASYVITIKNFGNSVALSTAVLAEATFALDQIEPIVHSDCEAASVMSRGRIDNAASLGFHDPLSAGTLFQGDGVGYHFNDKPIKQGKLAFRFTIVGCVVYRDQFHNERHTRFCYTLSADPKQTTFPAFMYQCELGPNDAD